MVLGFFENICLKHHRLSVSIVLDLILDDVLCVITVIVFYICLFEAIWNWHCNHQTSTIIIQQIHNLFSWLLSGQ